MITLAPPLFPISFLAWVTLAERYWVTLGERPSGMQVEWRTVQLLGATKAVDLWYLFPLGVGVSRLLTRGGHMDESWASRLDALLGTPEWRDEFYKPSQTLSLFPEQEPTFERTATPESIEAFVHRRLGSCFEGVARGLVLKNSRSNPMYLLCFAAANRRGAPIALRIAQHLLDE
jgi:three-Cys-motif partner protein